MRQSIQPISAIAAAWLLGLLCSQAAPNGAWRAALSLAAFALSSLLGLWAALTQADAQNGARGGLAPLAILSGLVCLAGLALPVRAYSAASPSPSGMARLTAVVEQSSALNDGEASSIIRVVRGARLEDDAPVSPGAFLVAGPASLPAGATVRLLAKLAPQVAFRNPTPHPMPEPRYPVSGRAWVADARAVEVLEQSFCLAGIEAARGYVRARLDQTLAPRAAEVARALVLGDDRVLDAADAAQVRAVGLLHVFAVSGLHVAILAGLFVWAVELGLRFSPLARRFRVQRIACALGIPSVLLYASFAGGAPSAWRAAVTAAVGWGVVVCGRRPDAVAVNSSAVIVLGGLDPEQVVRPAFLLSIVATSAILGGHFAPAREWRSWLRDAFLLSARTAVATAPISLWFFGNVALTGVLANVVLLPFGSLLLVQLSALHALICALTPWGAWSAPCFALVSDAFLASCGVFSRLAPSMVWPVPDVAQGLVAALGAVVLLLSRGLRARLITVLAMLLALAALEWRLRSREQPRGALRVSFLDVGQGDAALIDLPDGRLMLIDAGGNPAGGPDPGERVLLPMLQARRRSRIDVAVLTHPHPDHYGGLEALLTSIPLAELWDSAQAEAESELQTTSARAAELLSLARSRGSVVRGPGDLCGKGRDFGGAKVEVLAPCPSHDSGFDPNDNSLVLRIEYGARSILFAGDAEGHEESRLLESGARLRSDVLKVAHHGSRTSSGEAFLRAVQPQLALISSGAGNRFGHPDSEVVERLRATGAQVVRLDQDGGTVLFTDGSIMRAETWSGRRLEPGPRRASSELHAGLHEGG